MEGGGGGGREESRERESRVRERDERESKRERARERERRGGGGGRGERERERETTSSSPVGSMQRKKTCLVLPVTRIYIINLKPHLFKGFTRGGPWVPSLVKQNFNRTKFMTSFTA
jgi:hypothetical protein